MIGKTMAAGAARFTATQRGLPPTQNNARTYLEH
jgi:hypothetical protein